ncbi:MAG: ornithine--oxo-acid transaminase [Ectothiorhodospiraceae bacterium]|nr:ornithine--oxo-acid transaminase [Ectothiorhodospiraceae bacterium]
MNTQELIALEEEYGAHNYHPLDVVIERAEGVWVYDVEGNKYLDCLAAYSAVNQGHCHPKILEVFQEQAKKVTLTSRAFRNDQLPLLYKQLHDMTGFDLSLPMNSGAEAVETALKAARKWGYTVKGIPQDKAEIICATDNFHGRTITIVSFSTEHDYRNGYGPMTPGFPIVKYGDIEDMKAKINENTAAIMLEPIQGEAGIIIPPDGYLKEVEKLCRENNILLIMDEIQSGLGRSGKLFAYEHEGIQPDAVIIGKALSAGFVPVSAVLAKKEVLGVFKPGEHGSTFGGNPLAAAVARASLQVIVDEKLVERSAELGTYFIDELRNIDSPHIKEVRGRGLWIGFELNTAARPYCEALMEEGILCKETHENVIRIAPPLVITKEEIDWALERIRKVVSQLAAAPAA